MRSQIAGQSDCLKQTAADLVLHSFCPSGRSWELKRVPWLIESLADISQAPILSRPYGLQCIILFYPRLSYELDDVPILQMEKARLREFRGYEHVEGVNLSF